MPLYEYHCTHCESDFEDLVRIGTPDEQVTCPACGARAKRCCRCLSPHEHERKRHGDGRV